MSLTKKDYLIQFDYDVYCQGYERATETILVRDCKDKIEACEKIRAKYYNARNFINKELM